jgi:hypothetical protein
MCTYRLGNRDAVQAVSPRPGSPRELLCEQCGADVWVLDSEQGPEAHAGMTAERVAALWPGAADAVRRHEDNCPRRPA